MKVKRTRRGVRVEPDEVEATVLGQCLRDLLVLLASGPDAARREADQDPLAAMVGMPVGDPVPPEDPALARLLPDAYADDDPAASREFRRYTEGDLRAGKRAACETVLATLPAKGGTVVLDRDQADAWLGALNDLRLVLGTRLGVTEQTDPDDYPPGDPAGQALHVYSWLGWLQESLLGCLDPRPS